MSQATMLDPNTVNNMCVQLSQSSSCEGYCLTLGGDASASKQSHAVTATDSIEDKSLKTFFKNTLIKARNLIARIFSHKNVKGAVDIYVDKAHDPGIACRQAGHKIYKRATVPGDGTTSTAADSAMQPSQGKPSNTSCKAKIAYVALCALCAVVGALRLLHATVTTGLDAGLAAVETTAAAAYLALNKLCEEG